MMLKKIALATAAAALLTSGAIAQNSPNTTTAPQNAPETPSATTPAAPSATTPPTTPETAPSMTEKKPMTETAAGSIQFSSTLSSDQMAASKLIGMSVYNSADENLGDVNDLIVDKDGKPSFIVVGVGGFLGIGEKNVGIPFEHVQFAMNKDNDRIARLDLTKETLESAPGFVYIDEPEKTAVKTN